MYKLNKPQNFKSTEEICVKLNFIRNKRLESYSWNEIRPTFARDHAAY